jgi:hypothetical protein
MKPLRVEFDMTSEDLPAAAEAVAVADRDPDFRMARRKAQRTLTVGILFFAAVLALDLARDKPKVFTASMSLVAGGIIGLVLRLPTRRSWGRLARQQTAAKYTSAAGRAALGSRLVEVGHDGLAITSEFAHTLVTWRGVIDVFPTLDHLVVVMPGPVSLCVPRRAFGNDGEFEQFGEVVTELARAGGGLTGRAPPS